MLAQLDQCRTRVGIGSLHHNATCYLTGEVSINHYSARYINKDKYATNIRTSGGDDHDGVECSTVACVTKIDVTVAQPVLPINLSPSSSPSNFQSNATAKNIRASLYAILFPILLTLDGLNVIRCGM